MRILDVRLGPKYEFDRFPKLSHKCLRERLSIGPSCMLRLDLHYYECDPAALEHEALTDSSGRQTLGIRWKTSGEDAGNSGYMSVLLRACDIS